MNRWGIMRKTMRDVRIATIAVALVIALIAWLDVLIYPQYRETLADEQFGSFIEGFTGGADLASPEGFIAAELFSWVPLLLITVALIGGTGATAGEESAGTLDLLLAQPITRRRLLLEKTAGLACAIVLGAFAAIPGLLAGQLLVEFDLGVGRLLAATLNMLPVSFLFLGLSLWLGAALPTRAAAAMVAIGAVVVAYFLNLVGAAADVLEAPRKLSPFYWADAAHVLTQGFDIVRSAGLLAVSALLLILAVRSFDRRDIGTGAAEFNWRAALGVRRTGRRESEAPEAGTKRGAAVGS